MQRLAFVIIALALCCVQSEYFEECSEVSNDTFVPVVDDCHSYIHCSDNEDETYKDECPEGTYFEENSLECVIDELNICPRGEITTTLETEQLETDVPITEAEKLDVTTMFTTPATYFTEHAEEYDNFTTLKPVCDRHMDAFYPHHKRCEYYYKCVAGFLTILRCNFFYAWDYRKEMCVPRKEVECYGNSKLRKLFE